MGSQSQVWTSKQKYNCCRRHLGPSAVRSETLSFSPNIALFSIINERKLKIVIDSQAVINQIMKVG